MRSIRAGIHDGNGKGQASTYSHGGVLIYRVVQMGNRAVELLLGLRTPGASKVSITSPREPCIRRNELTACQNVLRAVSWFVMVSNEV